MHLLSGTASDGSFVPSATVELANVRNFSELNICQMINSFWAWETMADYAEIGVGLSFEWHPAERAVVVYHKMADGSRTPFAYLYTRLEVDTFALQLEASEFSAGAIDALQLVARNLDK